MIFKITIVKINKLIIYNGLWLNESVKKNLHMHILFTHFIMFIGIHKTVGSV